MTFVRALTSYFSPPSFLSMPAVGVDVSERSLKYIQLHQPSLRGSGLRVQYYGDRPLNEPTVTGGEVANEVLLAEQFAQIHTETGCAYVRLALPEERAYLFETSIDRSTPFSEIYSMLEFRLEENVPLAAKDAYFDYDVFETPHAPESLGVAVTVYATETVEGYLSACEKGGVIPLSFEVEAQALARSILPSHDTGTYMLIDMGNARTGIGIVHAGVLLYTSTIEIGGAHLLAALKEQIHGHTDDEYLAMLNTVGLGEQTEDASSVAEVIRPPIRTLVEELTLRIEYWNTHDEHPTPRYIEGLLLCGGTANVKNLPEHLTNMLGVPARRGQVWRNAIQPEDGYVPPIDKVHSYGYATAIGLALRNL